MHVVFIAIDKRDLKLSKGEARQREVKERHAGQLGPREIREALAQRSEKHRQVGRRQIPAGPLPLWQLQVRQFGPLEVRQRNEKHVDQEGKVWRLRPLEVRVPDLELGPFDAWQL